MEHILCSAHPLRYPLGIADVARIRGYVSEDELTDAYRRSGIFAFLSEYEGFGLTPLEALSAGVPIVVLDTPVAREIYGDAAVYAAAGDIHGIADALTRLLVSPAERAAQLAKAPAVLSRYSWDAAAERTLAVLDGAARR